MSPSCQIMRNYLKILYAVTLIPSEKGKITVRMYEKVIKNNSTLLFMENVPIIHI